MRWSTRLSTLCLAILTGLPLLGWGSGAEAAYISTVSSLGPDITGDPYELPGSGLPTEEDPGPAVPPQPYLERLGLPIAGADSAGGLSGAGSTGPNGAPTTVGLLPIAEAQPPILVGRLRTLRERFAPDRRVTSVFEPPRCPVV